MIRDGKRLPDDVLESIPVIIEIVSGIEYVEALYSFGSITRNELHPLSDLDFGILLSEKLNRESRIKKHLDLIHKFNDAFKTDEIDLILMNNSPARFNYNIIKTGKLLFVRDKSILANFREHIIKEYLDFKYFRDDFDSGFLKGIGYNG